MVLRIATRGSDLALWQANYIANRLSDHGDVEIIVISTEGDRVQDRPIWEIGGRGVFVKEVQAAILDGRADLAVHSAKDLPASSSPPGLALACVPERGDPRDALVGTALADLRPGAVIATGSMRRRAQLAHLRPDLQFKSLRGNIATRIAKASEVDAVPVAAVALQRLGLDDVVADILEPFDLLPQVAQGALAVECRVDDEATLKVLASIEHRQSRICIDAERSFLAELGGGCEVPVAAMATLSGDTLKVEGLIAGLDGRIVLRSLVTGSDTSIGADLAKELLGSGGRQLLDDLLGEGPL